MVRLLVSVTVMFLLVWRVVWMTFATVNQRRVPLVSWMVISVAHKVVVGPLLCFMVLMVLRLVLRMLVLLLLRMMVGLLLVLRVMAAVLRWLMMVTGGRPVLLDRSVALLVVMVRTVEGRLRVRVVSLTVRLPLTIQRDKRLLEVTNMHRIRNTPSGYWNRRKGGRSWIRASLLVIAHPSPRWRRRGLNTNRVSAPWVIPIRIWWPGKRVTRREGMERLQGAAPPARGWGVCHRHCI
jgi:hypothetical protein